MAATIRSNAKRQGNRSGIFAIWNAESQEIDNACEHILGQFVRMIDHPEKWVIAVRKDT